MNYIGYEIPQVLSRLQVGYDLRKVLHHFKSPFTNHTKLVTNVNEKVTKMTGVLRVFEDGL